MKNFFALLLIVGLLAMFTFGCIQQPEKPNLETGNITIGTAENTTSEVNETSITTNETANETVPIIPKEEPKCEESKVYSGKCADNSKVKEEICINGTLENKTTSCETNYLCENGVCKPDPTKCIDSDGGENMTTAGSVIYLGKEYKDYCNSGNHVEYYCQNGKVSGSQNPCPIGYGCSFGKCEVLAQQCIDNGTKVTVRNIDEYLSINESYCLNRYQLMKYYCNEKILEWKTISCAWDEWCSNSTRTCEKKKCDNGYGDIIAMDSLTPDGIYYKGQFFIDICMAKDEIKDFYCSGTHAYNRTKLCPTNYLCVNMTAMNLTLENGTVKEIQPSYCEFMIK